METASSCGGVRHKRYSGQLEIAPEKQYKNVILSYYFPPILT